MLNNINEQLVIHLRKLGYKIQNFQAGKGSQSRVLMVLLTNPGMTQQKLTEHLDIKPASVSEILSKLQKVGYITRQPSIEDRRTSNISLTKEGLIQAKIALDEKKENYDHIFACLSDEEKEIYLNLTKKLNEHLQNK